MGYFAKYKNTAEFMQGRKKGNLKDVVGSKLFIEDYQILNGEQGEYVALIFKDIDGLFYFGNKILLDIVKGTEKDNMTDLIFSTPVVVELKTNRNGSHEYWNWNFIEE